MSLPFDFQSDKQRAHPEQCPHCLTWSRNQIGISKLRSVYQCEATVVSGGNRKPCATIWYPRPLTPTKKVPRND